MEERFAGAIEAGVIAARLDSDGFDDFEGAGFAEDLDLGARTGAVDGKVHGGIRNFQVLHAHFVQVRW